MPPTRQPDPRASTEFTPLEMASAFGTYAAEGMHVTPHLVTPRRGRRRRRRSGSRRSTRRGTSTSNVARVVTQASGRHHVRVRDGGGHRPARRRQDRHDAGSSRDAWFVGLRAAAGHLGVARQPRQRADRGRGDRRWSRRAAVGRVHGPRGRGARGRRLHRPRPPSSRAAHPRAPRSAPRATRSPTRRPRPTRTGSSPTCSTDITDEDGRPCVEDTPSPNPSRSAPTGFAFADPPGATPTRSPRCSTDITDERRPALRRDRPAARAGTRPEEPDGRNRSRGADEEPTEEPTDDGLIDGLIDGGDADDGTDAGADDAGAGDRRRTTADGTDGEEPAADGTT